MIDVGVDFVGQEIDLGRLCRISNRLGQTLQNK